MESVEISQISPNPLLRTIGVKDIERIATANDWECELVEEEYQDLRHSVHTFEIEGGIHTLHRDGLVDSGNRLEFEEVSPDIRWTLVGSVAKIVVENKGIEIDSGFEPEKVVGMDVTTPEGFLVNSLEDKDKKKYMTVKKEILNTYVRELQELEEKDFEGLKEITEDYYERKTKLTENYL